MSVVLFQHTTDPWDVLNSKLEHDQLHGSLAHHVEVLQEAVQHTQYSHSLFSPYKVSHHYNWPCYPVSGVNVFPTLWGSKILPSPPISYPSFPFPLLSSFPPPYPSPPFPFPLEVGLLIQLEGLREHCKLSQWDLGLSPSRQRFWCILRVKERCWWHSIKMHGFKQQKMQNGFSLHIYKEFFKSQLLLSFCK